METKRVSFLDKISFVTLIITLFTVLFFFMPYLSLTLEASKGFLVSIGTILSLFFWLLARLMDGKFSIPKERLILFALFLPIIYLASSLFSLSFYLSFLGNGFELGTFGSMLVLFLIFFLSLYHFQSEKRFTYFIKLLFVGGLVLIIFELINLFYGFNRISPGILNGINAGNLVGSWNDFSLFFGLIALLAVYTLELFKTRKVYTILQYFLLTLSILFLIVINMPMTWLLVGLFSVIIFVYCITSQQLKLNNAQLEIVSSKFPFTSLAVIIISLLLLIGSTTIGGFVSKYINLTSLDVRPSIETTAKIGLKAIAHNPILGTGPNTFMIDWSLWQQKGIAQTVFWNVDFTSGFSTLTTTLSTVGILGFLAFLLFLIVFVVRGVQCFKLSLGDKNLNYFLVTTFMVSIYSWICFVFYNPSIIMLVLAFSASGVLIGILTHKKVISVNNFSFLKDPRYSFFSILGIVVFMIGSVMAVYIYATKLISLVYYSKAFNSEGSNIEILAKSEKMLLGAINMDKNDRYYRTLSQVYLSEIKTLLEEKNISEDVIKTNLQKLIDLSQNNALLAVRLNPKYYQNYMNLGNIYSSLVPLGVDNSYENAVSAYDQAQQLAPNNPLVLLSRAQLEYLNKNNESARNFINEAVNLKANYIDAVFLLVQIETEEGNLVEAIRQVELATKMSSNDSTVFFMLGLLKYNNQDYRGAVGALENAVLLNGRYLNARYYLGLTYQKLGRKEDARIQFELLNKLSPDNNEVLNALNSLNGSFLEDNDEPKKTKDEITKPPLKEKQ